MLPLVHVLNEINRRHGTTFRLVRRYQRGEQGAFALEDATGRGYVLKRPAYAGYLDGVRMAVAATDALRATGYPVPRYVLSGAIDGAAYAIQEALPGAPLGDATAEVLPRLLALNDLQRERGVPIAAAAPSRARWDWPAPVVETVLEGGDGYCVLRLCGATRATRRRCWTGCKRLPRGIATSPVRGATWCIGTSRAPTSSSRTTA